ncbi:MAG: alpha/beta hydrolase family protein [Solirubrobacteraceae bacterium]
MPHSYGPHRHQFCELALPEGGGSPAPPHPVAALIHGGFWRDRYCLDLMDALAGDLTARGWAVWNVEYRRLGESGGGVPQTTDDVAAAIDALADVDAPLDLGRVVAIGHSAGGHLALWAAGREHPRVPLAAAVGQAPVCDLDMAFRMRLSDGVVADFVGGSPADVPERYDAACPRRRLPTGVPQLLVHGEADDIVPAALSRGYVKAAREAGDHATLVLRSSDGHFEHIEPGSVAWAAVLQWLAPWAP